jgi:DNA invertase Pin-like site-specific DNA recombinase
MELPAMNKTRPRRAYSYIRFSTGTQAKGGSLNRQVKFSTDYCKRKGLVLDDSLTLRDLGVSAFRSDNVREGALAGFLEACRSGRVPRGSVLIVESLDRLSRDQIRPALQLFMAIQDFGVTIVTQQPEREYPPDDTDALSLIEPLIVFARAHEESEMKSHRRRDGWRQARDRARVGGGPMLKTCPAWLEVTPDGFRVKEAEAEVVRRIFAWCREGMGIQRITMKLTQEKVPPFGAREPVADDEDPRTFKASEGKPLGSGKWTKPYVYHILATPAAMGTHQPRRQEGRKAVPDGEPIPNYYPAVVTEEEWQEAQTAMRIRAGEFDANGHFQKDGRGSPAAGRKGKNDQETNLFSGLVYYALTGEKMYIVHALGRKGEGERKRYVYLCPNRETGLPKSAPRIDYAAFEKAVLSELKELKPADIAPDEKHANGRETEIARLSGRLLDIDSRLERARQRARTAGDFDTFLDLIAELQAERKQVSERLAELRHEEDSQPATDLGEAQTLIGMLNQAAAEQREALRRRLKVRIRQLVAEMWVVIVPRGRNRVCVLQIWFAGGNRHRDYIIWHNPRDAGDVRPFSFADVAKPGELDLRKRAHARRLEKALRQLVF